MRSFRRFAGYFRHRQSYPHKPCVALAGSAAGIVGLTSLSQSNVAMDPLSGLPSTPRTTVVHSMNGPASNSKGNDVINRLDAETREGSVLVVAMSWMLNCH